MQPHDMIGLYDTDGARVGTYCSSTGRAQIGAMFYVPERTCLPMYDGRYGNAPKCSLCGELLSDGMVRTAKFCPECGARVKED